MPSVKAEVREIPQPVVREVVLTLDPEAARLVAAVLFAGVSFVKYPAAHAVYHSIDQVLAQDANDFYESVERDVDSFVEERLSLELI